MAHDQAGEELRIAVALRALSLPNRLRLLRILQLPHTAAEVRLFPWREDGSLDANRPMSRQAVEGHLAKLADAGLVGIRAGERGGRSVKEYTLDQAGLFVLLEDLRRLALLRPGWDAQTVAAGAVPHVEEGPLVLPAADKDGPAIVYLSGPLEGRAVALSGNGPWEIGRLSASDVPLAHDPFVSAKNASIERRGRKFVLVAAPDARNGTAHNWQRVDAAHVCPLHSGDTIGVGRSLLLFRRP